MRAAPDGALHEHKAGEVVQPLVRHRCKQEGDQGVQSPGGQGYGGLAEELGRRSVSALSVLQSGGLQRVWRRSTKALDKDTQRAPL
jgi:hypothetical protein